MKKIAVLTILSALLLFLGLQGLNFFDDRFKYGRMWETPAVRPHEAKLPVMDVGSVPFSDGEAFYRSVDGKSLLSPLYGKEAGYVKEGETLYFTYCAQCHGKNLDGNGTVGQSFSPLPTDLRSPLVRSLHEGVLFKRISYGNPPDGKQPPLATTIDFLDRWKIIAFIKLAGREKDSL
jgi:hypothetical protein